MREAHSVLVRDGAADWSQRRGRRVEHDKGAGVRAVVVTLALELPPDAQDVVLCRCDAEREPREERDVLVGEELASAGEVRQRRRRLLVDRRRLRVSTLLPGGRHACFAIG